MPHSEGRESPGGDTHIFPVKGRSLCGTSAPERNADYPRNDQTESERERRVRKIYWDVIREATYLSNSQRNILKYQIMFNFP